MPDDDLLNNKRIFVGFDHAGSSGIYAYTRALKHRGYQIDYYGKVKSKFKRPVDINLEFSDRRLISLWQAIKYFFRILPKYDIWHFNYAQTFFICPLNLLILKLWGKKIVCTFRGNDAVLNFDFLPMKLYKKSAFWPQYYHNLIAARFSLTLILNWIRMKSFLLLADQIIIIGPFLASSVSYYDWLIPYTSGAPKVLDMTPKNKIRIFHAPTDQIVKGTAAIERAFKKLSSQFPKHEFVIKENLTHEEVTQEMIKADIVVDQLLVGWYGEQAAEAMAMGKTVMAYLNPTYFNFVSFAQEIPVINTNHWTFENDLKKLLDCPQSIRKTAKESFKFAKKYHSPGKISRQYLEVYRACYLPRTSLKK